MACLRCWLSTGPLKRDFLDNYLITFPESVIPEIEKKSGSKFLSKCSRFNSDLKNAEKK